MSHTFGADIKKAIHVLAQHNVLGVQTDTVFGLAANSNSSHAIEIIYKLKKREYTKPLPCLFYSIEQIKQYANINALEEQILRLFPVPVTIIVSLKHHAAINTKFCMYKNHSYSIAVRIPKHDLLLKLLYQLNHPLFITSANITNLPEIITLDDMLHLLGTHLQYILVDTQLNCTGTSSVIIDMTTDPPTILRHNKYQNLLSQILENHQYTTQPCAISDIM